MKNFIWLATAVLAASAAQAKTPKEEAAAAAAPQTVDSSLPSARAYTVRILKSCTPDAMDLLQRYSTAPGNYTFNEYGAGGLAITRTVDLGDPVDFMTYINGDSAYAVLRDLPTAVHESTHGYAGRTAWQAVVERQVKMVSGQKFLNYYVSPSSSFLVGTTATFPSLEIAPSVPNGLRADRYRYVDSEDTAMGTQALGIYGLLDELDGYLTGTRTALSVLTCGWEDAGLSADHWFGLFANVENGLVAHLEFRYFILHYLNYARDRHPEIYRGVMGNAEFRAAFRAIDGDFVKLRADYEREAAGLMERLSAKGVPARIDAEGIWFATRGQGRHKEKHAELDEALANPELKSLYDELMGG